VEDDILRQYRSNIGLSSTTVTYEACNAIEFGKIKKNKGYYVNIEYE